MKKSFHIFNILNIDSSTFLLELEIQKNVSILKHLGKFKGNWQNTQRLSNKERFCRECVEWLEVRGISL